MCTFCNLGEHSQLGQGELIRIQYTETVITDDNQEQQENAVTDTEHVKTVIPFRRQRSIGIV